MFQQFRQRHQGTFAILGENLQEHFEYCTLTCIQREETKEICVNNVVIN